MRRKQTKEAIDELTINSGQVLLDGVTDITNYPMINYIGFTHEGSCFLRPHVFEMRSEGTCIVVDDDGDRPYYTVFWRNKEMGYFAHRDEAEKCLEDCEQMQREADHCKDCGAFGYDILEGLE